MKLTDATTLRERLNISRLALAHPRATIAVWALVAIAGIWAYGHLRLALFPDVTFPLVVVTAEAPGLSPQEVEAGITLPIEQRMHGLRDLKSLESSSSPGKTLVAVEFEVGVSLREARHRVDSALAGIQVAGGAVPGTRPIDINESPVVTYVLVGEYRTPAQLMGTALGTFLPAIEKVPGVLHVVPLGVDPAAVATSGGDSAVDTHLPHTVAWLNGQQGVALEVVKEAGANTIEVVREVDSVVSRLQWENQDIHAVPAVTQADFIRGSTRATTDALWLAVALSVLVIFPFLRSWKATGISALAIPISLLRHIRRHEAGRVRAGDADAARPRAGHRHHRGRRHRRRREHPAPHRPWRPAARRGHRRDRRDRPHGHGRDAHHRRRIPSGGPHGRGDGHLLPSLRAHHFGRSGDVAARRPHALAPAVGLVAPAGAVDARRRPRADAGPGSRTGTANCSRGRSSIAPW